VDHFSYSQVRSFLSCEYKWYVDKVLGIRRIETKRAPTLGSAIHEGIAAAIKGQPIHTAIEDFVGGQLEKLEPHFHSMPSLGDDWDAVRSEIELHAESIVDRWATWIKLDEWETVAHPEFGPLVENRLTHIEGSNKLDIEFEFPWIVDWVALHKPTGLTWVIDWKTKSQFQDEKVHEYNLQKMVYQYLLGEIGIEVTGSRICQIRSKAPSVPKLNKNGSMSRAQISTTWEVYKDALNEADIEPDDYVEMKMKFPDASYWFAWMSAHRREEECEAAWHNIIIPAIARMRSIRQEEKPPIRNLGSIDCTQMCNVQLLCMETLRGYDVDNVIDFGYERRE
jgi:hypothetical protein